MVALTRIRHPAKLTPHEHTAMREPLVVARLTGRPCIRARIRASRAATGRWTALFFV